jgi:hypothetical protein
MRRRRLSWHTSGAFSRPRPLPAYVIYEPDRAKAAELLTQLRARGAIAFIHPDRPDQIEVVGATRRASEAGASFARNESLSA